MWSNTGEDDDPGPTNTTACVFKDNSADDGGAMYSAAGYDIIQDSLFEANFAGTEFNLAPIITGEKAKIVAADFSPRCCVKSTYPRVVTLRHHPFISMKNYRCRVAAVGAS